MPVRKLRITTVGEGYQIPTYRGYKGKVEERWGVTSIIKVNIYLHCPFCCKLIRNLITVGTLDAHKVGKSGWKREPNHFCVCNLHNQTWMVIRRI